MNHAHELVERRTSGIPGAGDGLFAKCEIAAGTVLFTYTAEPIKQTLKLSQDRHYTFTVGVTTYCATLDDLGGYINDIVDFKQLTPDESVQLFRGTAPTTHYKYNCQYRHDAATRRLEIITLDTIAPDQELFVSYGVNYWIPRYITGRKITGVARVTTGGDRALPLAR
ncbi:metallopeptidase [Faustovirus]|nr:metallopeptidase [Faustovirus]